MKHIDKDEALLTCETIMAQITKKDINYADLFCKNVEKVFSIGKLLDEAWSIRNVILGEISLKSINPIM